MLHLEQSPESFYNSVIDDYREELSNTRNEYRKKELEDKLGKFKSIYNRLLVNNNSSSDISPKPIKGNCVFFE